MLSDNPFFNNSANPDFSKADASSAKTALVESLNLAKANISKIENLKDEEISFDSVIRALDVSTEKLSQVWTIANHIESVVSTQEMRELIATFEPEISEFYSSICINEKLWDKIQKFSQKNENLDQEAQKLFDDTKNSFIRNGANLNSKDKQKLTQLDATLASLTRKFSENALDAQNEFELLITAESELEGLPSSAKNLAIKKAQEKNLNGYLLTLDAPIFIPLLSHCKNENLRKTLWIAHSELCSNGKFSNIENMRKIIETRQAKAELLGKANFADFVLEDRMAHSGANALSFIENLHDKIYKYYQKEISQIEEFAGKSPIEPWNASFYAEQMRKQNYDFSSEEFRPYITLEGALKGAFEVAESLYGLKIKSAEAKSWHDSVLFFEVYDASEKHIANFYADFFPRKGKRQGAWMNLLKDGDVKLGLIAGNFNEATKDAPALLNHDELSTLFHEFGHLVHFILMNCRERGLRNVAWDFVELPSQIMENWCAKKEVLDRFASHYKTGEKLPDSIFEKFKKSQKFRGASFFMRQLSFAKIDLELHINSSKYLQGDIEENAQKTLAEYSQKYTQTPHTILPHFTHIFGDSVGYAAGYYSYKWAESLDADAFTRFENEGLFNRKTGEDFANSILRVGSSINPEIAFENFMHRKPNPDAMIARAIDTDAL